VASTLRFTHTFTVQLAEAGTTDATFLSYSPDLSRVQVDLSVLATIDGSPPPAGATRVVERSTDLITWTTVRGGSETDLVAAGTLSDYEFATSSTSFYRINVFVAGELFWTFRDQILVVLDSVWLKFLRYPFLNRPVTVVDYSDLTRPSRNGVFDIKGRTSRVAVFGQPGSRAFELQVLTQTAVEAADFDLTTASNSAVFLHVPSLADAGIPTMYAALGDVTLTRPLTRLSPRRQFNLPLTEVAAPASEFIGGTITCAGLLNRYGTCADVLSMNATCTAVLALIGVPGDVIVS
jgi:hypothetical protein